MTKNAGSAAPKQRGRPFKPGQSGNPRGRLPGTKNHATRIVAEMFAGEAERLARRAIDLALSGDVTALRLVLERIAPPARERSLEIEMPALAKPADLAPAVARVLDLVACGAVTIGEGAKLAELLGAWRQAAELGELEERIRALEQRGTA